VDSKRPHPIVNLDELELQPRPAAMSATGEAAQRFDARVGQIGACIGMQKLGCNLTVVPPGKAAFPIHNHLANEEMFYVVSGNGEVRIGDARHAIRAGDVIACPPGGRETAHQIVNTGDAELRYLAISTKLFPEVCEYPDSDKFGVMAVTGQDANGQPAMFRYIGRATDSRDYWEGE